MQILSKALTCDLDMKPAAKIPDPSSSSIPAFSKLRNGAGHKISNWTFLPRNFQVIWPDS